MSRLVLILARSGTGKSTSLRNFKKGEAQAILCSGKELPFKTDIATFVPKGYADVQAAIQKASLPVVVLDDVNYLMSMEEMSMAQVKGYEKFSIMALNMFNVFKAIMDKDTDQTYYLLAHSSELTETDSQLRFKTTGKMLSEKVVLEGLTNIVIGADVQDGDFVFKVKTDGTGIKTPIGMFTTPTVPNDLKEVDKIITAYYKPAKETK
jgi:hypothetical protein